MYFSCYDSLGLQKEFSVFISIFFFSQVPEVKQLASALHLQVVLVSYCIKSMAVVWNWSTLTNRVDPLKEFGDTVFIILSEYNFDLFFKQNVILEVL